MNRYETDLGRIFAFLLGQRMEPKLLRQSLERLLREPDAWLYLEDAPRFLEAIAALDEGVVFPEMKAIFDHQPALGRLYKGFVDRLQALRSTAEEPSLGLKPYPLVATVNPLEEWTKIIGGELQRWQDEIRIRFSTLSNPPATALAFSGLKGKKSSGDRGADVNSLRMHLDPEQTGGAEVEAILLRDEGQPASLLVRVIIPDRWPQLDGVTVRAASQDWQAEGVTDAEGQVTFRDMSTETIDDLEICVALPKA